MAIPHPFERPKANWVTTGEDSIVGVAQLYFMLDNGPDWRGGGRWHGREVGGQKKHQEST